MAVSQFIVERVTRITSSSFAEVVANIENAVGRPDLDVFEKRAAETKSWQEFEQLVQKAVGPSGFMEFARFDLGGILAKEKGAAAPQIIRFIIGNPLIMKELAELIPDTGLYAPITLLVDEREDGVHISYDTMASHIAPYGNEEALDAAMHLDLKVEALLRKAAN